MFSRGLFLVSFSLSIASHREEGEEADVQAPQTPQTNRENPLNADASKRFHISSPGVEFRVGKRQKEFSVEKMS